MATVRLDQQEPHAREFTATVIAHAAYAARPAVVLDRSAFYPEAGGQQSDRGALSSRGLVAEPPSIPAKPGSSLPPRRETGREPNDTPVLTVDAVVHPVVDVQIDDAGVVHHLIDGALPPVGAVVAGAIDRARRRVHMALHTGQHLLSRALIEAAGAPTVSARLGERDCTIDVTRDAVPERELAAAEALANQIIDDDVDVRAWFPEPDELAALPLRREPKVEREIRVVAIGDFDVSPCGGTHCTRTGQLGAIRIVATERYKGMTRVTFAAGARTRELLGSQATALGEVARALSCGPLDVPAVVDKLRRSLTEARADAVAVRERLALALAGSTRRSPGRGGSRSPSTRSRSCDRWPPPSNAAGKRCAPRRRHRRRLQVLLARADGSALDCGALWKRLAAAPADAAVASRPTPRAGCRPASTGPRRSPARAPDATPTPWPSACRRPRTARAPSGCRPSSRRSAAGR
jgi:alanyl-tRNA synthetase